MNIDVTHRNFMKTQVFNNLVGIDPLNEEEIYPINVGAYLIKYSYNKGKLTKELIEKWDAGEYSKIGEEIYNTILSILEKNCDKKH